MKRRNEFVNLPNSITALRIILLFPIIGLFLRDKIISAFAVLIIAILSDFFDGMVAKLTKEVTEFGKLFDAFADKWLIQGILLCIGFKFISVWSIAISIGLDFILVALPAFNRYLKIKRRAGSNIWGKTKMVFQCLTATLLFLGLLFGLDFHKLASTSLWIANGFAVASIFKHVLTKEEAMRF